MATKAVNKVRCGEHLELMKDARTSLCKINYTWLTSFENLSEKQQAVFDATNDHRLQTGLA